MEVHHPPDLHHQPKPWKEYFVEFIMIFLAVTLGFFAESLREYRSDRAKEKEYVISFLKNLAQDTSDLNYFISENKKKVNGLDTLGDVITRYLDNAEFYEQNFDNLYFDSVYQYCSLYIGLKYIFQSSNATMVQLKNSGEFRLIQTGHAGDSIAVYDVINERTQLNSNIYMDLSTQLFDTWARCLDLSYLTRNRSFLYVPRSAIIAGPDGMKYFYNKTIQCAATIDSYATTHLKRQLECARRLIAYLKKVYNIS
jgi:hypothetical protein